MTDHAASRFPALAPQAPIPRQRTALGMSLSLVPLPVGELSVLLTAWLLILPV